MTLPGVAELRRLLDHLLVVPGSVLVIEGLSEGGDIAADSPVPVTIIASIERNRRLVYGKKDFRESGLFEMRLGLLFMDSHRFDLAARQFEEARQQWVFLDDPYLTALADLGAGLSFHRAFQYERAMTHFQTIEKWLEKTADEHMMNQWSGREGERDDFLGRLRLDLAGAVQATRQSLQQLSRRSIPNEPVAPPIIDQRLTETGVEAPKPHAFAVDLDLERPSTVAVFLETVCPLLGAIEQIDRVLGSASGERLGGGLLVREFPATANLVIRLSGHHRLTPILCRSLLATESLTASRVSWGADQNDQAKAGPTEQDWIDWIRSTIGETIGEMEPERANLVAVILLPSVRKLLEIASQHRLTILAVNDTPVKGAIE